MKYLITILLICSGLLSCTNMVLVETQVVSKIELYTDKKSIYSTTGKALTTTINNENPRFIAPIGLYNVGDTIKFTK